MRKSQTCRSSETLRPIRLALNDLKCWLAKRRWWCRPIGVSRPSAKDPHQTELNLV